MIDPIKIAELLVIASQLSGRPAPADIRPPAVYELTAQQMADEMCQGKTDECDILGYYADDEKIFVRDDGGAHVSKNSIIVHELVHWLQQHNDFGGFSYPHNYSREMQAYFVQTLYIVKIEHKPDPSIRPPESLCAPVYIIRLR